jgi:hypothetical protein
MPFILDNLNKNYSFSELHFQIVQDGEKIKEIFKNEPDILKKITVEFQTVMLENDFGDNDEDSQKVADDCLEVLRKAIALRR